MKGFTFEDYKKHIEATGKEPEPLTGYSRKALETYKARGINKDVYLRRRYQESAVDGFLYDFNVNTGSPEATAAEIEVTEYLEAVRDGFNHISTDDYESLGIFGDSKEDSVAMRDSFIEVCNVELGRREKAALEKLAMEKTGVDSPEKLGIDPAYYLDSRDIVEQKGGIKGRPAADMTEAEKAQTQKVLADKFKFTGDVAKAMAGGFDSHGSADFGIGYE